MKISSPLLKMVGLGVVQRMIAKLSLLPGEQADGVKLSMLQLLNVMVRRLPGEWLVGMVLFS